MVWIYNIIYIFLLSISLTLREVSRFSLCLIYVLAEIINNIEETLFQLIDYGVSDLHAKGV